MRTESNEQTDREYGEFIKTRVPSKLRDELKDFCLVRGYKVQEFIRNAIEEKMLRERRPSHDNAA